MHLFDRDIVLTPCGSNKFNGNIADNWSINETPNGGYLLSILAHAMVQNSDKKETPILTASFYRRCAPGPVTIAVENVSHSNQFNHLQASLIQEGKEKIRALGTFASGSETCRIERLEELSPEIPLPENCTEVLALPGYSLYQNTDIRLDPASAGWMSGYLMDRSEIKGWVRFKNPRDFDLFSIAFIADAFPPPVFTTQGPVAWIPTLEFSVNVRRIPKGNWLKCVFRTRFINCGLLEEDGELWDETGSLVAISRQIAQFRPARRASTPSSG